VQVFYELFVSSLQRVGIWNRRLSILFTTNCIFDFLTRFFKLHKIRVSAGVDTTAPGETILCCIFLSNLEKDKRSQANLFNGEFKNSGFLFIAMCCGKF